MKKSISLLLLSLLMIAPGCQKTKEVVNEYNIVPKPNQILPQEGRFELNSKVSLVIPSDAPETGKKQKVQMENQPSALLYKKVCRRKDINYPLLPVSSRLPLLNRTGSSTAYRHFISYSLRRFTETSWIRKQTGRFVM